MKGSPALASSLSPASFILLLLMERLGRKGMKSSGILPSARMVENYWFEVLMAGNIIVE